MRPKDSFPGPSSMARYKLNPMRSGENLLLFRTAPAGHAQRSIDAAAQHGYGGFLQRNGSAGSCSYRRSRRGTVRIGMAFRSSGMPDILLGAERDHLHFASEVSGL